MTLVIGKDVPWNATWSAEERHEIRPCRHIGMNLAIWSPHKPGEGRPLFAKPHMVRQRKSIVDMRCTVCGERTDWRDRWWFPRGSWNEGWWMSTEAPVHLRCVDLARHACPKLRTAGGDPIPFPGGSKVLSAIVGGHATDKDFGVSIAGRRVVGHLKLAWRRPLFLASITETSQCPLDYRSTAV